MIRGVRGATTVKTNSKQEVMENTAELLQLMITENGIATEDIGAVIFSSTPDVNSAFPAAAARMLGWTTVPLFGAQEIDCPTGVPNCIRVLILWNCNQTQADIKHIYLKEAQILRPDLGQQND